MGKNRPFKPVGKCSASCGCSVDRRTFVKAAGGGALALLASRLPAMAGPFVNSDFERLVPADKKLSAAWVKSLFDRGAPMVYRGEALKYIGMPVGGICAGQLYLGGDGRLWHWDIFNQPMSTGADHYARPMESASPVEQRFVLKVGDRIHPLDRTGFSDVRFRGEYPIGIVEYRDPTLPIEVSLEAYSPFIPLNADDSSLPVTIMQFTIKNTGADASEVELTGRLENAVCLYHRGLVGNRRNRIVRDDGLTFLDFSAEASDQPAEAPRPDVVFEDWSKEHYDGWTVEGTAFGAGPVQKSAIPGYQGDVGGDTERVVNSHATAPGEDVAAKDAATGKLTSRPFVIERRFIQFWIGGGNLQGRTCLNLVVDGKAVLSATGQANNQMTVQTFEVCGLRGQEAVIEIVDAESGGWGNIGVGKITFTDKPLETGKLEEMPDFGTMGLGLLGEPPELISGETVAPLDEKLCGEIGRRLRLDAGQSATVTFLVAWHFPNLAMDKLPGGRRYAARFASAGAVAQYVSDNFDRLSNETKLWRDTWYDSTLPYWFLDRTFLNASILATSTCHRFKDGRFYGWEGVGCCAGTCGHVWQYAQAAARLFPALERDTRERVDFGLALQPDGAIHFRGEHNDIPAIDAQVGAILRAYREHQMSVDDAFLRRNWAGIKRATEWLIAKDANGNGIIESNQHNTLDTDWFGPVSWLSGLYLAALRAAEEMARETGDKKMAERCRGIFEKGRKNLVAQLFDGEYFLNQPDPQHADTINSGSGCEIDQVMGQSWAWQIGLGRVLPEEETRSALRSLWRYNFTPDVGPYREANPPGRWYAMAGEAGLLMCTFPRAEWNYDKAKGVGADWAAGYFNECMNGFEYQAAGHMIWEGLVQEGLAVTRAVHDRYDAARRNPWNEIECGDHYARSMASYGVFLAACGFEYHGPQGHIGFAPRLAPENFKAAFTSAEGWGTYRQTTDDKGLEAEIELKRGRLHVRTLALATTTKPRHVTVTRAGCELAGKHHTRDGRLLITLTRMVQLEAGEKLHILIS
jgi:uncharacterized protein (DUF608 family)